MDFAEVMELCDKSGICSGTTATVISVIILGILAFIFKLPKKLYEKLFKKKQKVELSPDQRGRFREVYDNLMESLLLFFSKDLETNEKNIKALLFKVKTQAAAELPEDIQKYTLQMYNKVCRYYEIQRGIETLKDSLIKEEQNERRSLNDDAFKLFDELIKEKPNEIFRKYLAIPSDEDKKQ